MSGLDKIISRLESDCDAECSAIESEALAKAHVILTDEEKACKAECDKIIADAQKEAELIARKAASSASLSAGRMMLEAKIGVIDETIEAAVNKLRALDTESYFSVLAHLAKKYALPGVGTMFLSVQDLERMPESFPDSLENVLISRAPADIKDGFLLKYGDIDVNCTFESMLNAAREDLKAVAGEILFG